MLHLFTILKEQKLIIQDLGIKPLVLMEHRSWNYSGQLLDINFQTEITKHEVIEYENCDNK